MFSPFLFAATLCRTAISSLTDFVITAFDAQRLAVYYRVCDLKPCTFIDLGYGRSRDRHPLSTLLVRHLLIIHMSDHFILFYSKDLHFILIRIRRHELGVFRFSRFLSDVFSQGSQILTVICLIHRMSDLYELLFLDPSVMPCDLLKTSDHPA